MPTRERTGFAESLPNLGHRHRTVLYVVRGAMSALACTLIEQDRPDGPRVTVRGLLRTAWPRIPAAIGSDFVPTTLLIPLLLTPGAFIGVRSPLLLLTLAPLVPFFLFAVWLWVLIALAPAVAAYERVGTGQAVNRSGRLVTARGVRRHRRPLRRAWPWARRS